MRKDEIMKSRSANMRRRMRRQVKYNRQQYDGSQNQDEES